MRRFAIPAAALALLSLLALAAGSRAQTPATRPATAPATQPAAARPAPPEAPVPAKLVFAFAKQKDPRALHDDAAEVARILTEEIGVPVEVLVPTSYGAVVQAVIAGKAHVTYTDSMPFLLARAEAPFELLLAEERDGRTDYHSIFVVRQDSPYQTLADLRGARMMFTSPTSTSGYVMAYSRLVDEGLLQKQQDPVAFFGAVNFAGGYDRALLAVANGQADACAVSDYTFRGAKADVYSTPEMREQLRILTETPGVPTHVIGIRSDLPQSLKHNIRDALLKIAKERPELLADVYGAARFVEVKEEEHVRGSVKALENTGLGAKGLVGVP